MLRAALLMAFVGLIGCGRLHYQPRPLDTSMQIGLDAGDGDSALETSVSLDTGVDTPSSDAEIDTGGADVRSDAGLDVGADVPMDANRDVGVDVFDVCSLCSPDATCTGGVCTCNPGFVGGGMVCRPRTLADSLVEAYIKASNTHTDDRFGEVALSGDGSTLAVGARSEDGSGTGVNPRADEGAMDSGAVYVYRRAGSSWAFEAYIKASNTGAGDGFGASLSLSGDGSTLAVSAPREDGSGRGVGPASNELEPNSGAAYVYRRTGTTWAFEAYIKATNTELDDLYGVSISLSDDGDVLAVGAQFESGSGTGVSLPSDEGATHSGAVYVYRRAGSVWAFEAYIKASNTGAFDQFGFAVGLSGDGRTLAVGATREAGSGRGANPASDNAAMDAGAVYIYRRVGVGSAWAYEAYLKASNTGAGDAFGASVALSFDGNVVATGAPYEDGSGFRENPMSDEGATSSGAVYVYRRVGSTWSFDAYLKASNTGANDALGSSIALSADGGVVVAGAPSEDGSGLGVNPPSDEAASGSGAAYVYRRGSTSWAFEAYVKAGSTGAGDGGGGSVSLTHDGALLAVGFASEDGSGMGVNPPTDEGALESGAVYLYR